MERDFVGVGPLTRQECPVLNPALMVATDDLRVYDGYITAVLVLHSGDFLYNYNGVEL